MDEPLTLEHVAILIRERQELLDALRELHRFAHQAMARVPHWYRPTDKEFTEAFDTAAKLLKKFETSDQG